MSTTTTKMISAAQAKDITTSINTVAASHQLKVLDAGIRKAAEEGKNQIFSSLDLLCPVIKELSSLGYQVKLNKAVDQRDTDYYTISW